MCLQTLGSMDLGHLTRVCIEHVEEALIRHLLCLLEGQRGGVAEIVTRRQLVLGLFLRLFVMQ
jgi:hypothetical protein